MAEEVEVARKILEAKGFVNDEAIDSLDRKIVVAQEVALVSTRNAEEVARSVDGGGGSGGRWSGVGWSLKSCLKARESLDQVKIGVLPIALQNSRVLSEVIFLILHFTTKIRLTPVAKMNTVLLTMLTMDVGKHKMISCSSAQA